MDNSITGIDNTLIERGIKTLLILLRDAIISDKYSDSLGLCNMTHCLLFDGTLNTYEYVTLNRFLSINRPKKPYKNYDELRKEYCTSLYWWKQGDFKVRLKFINKLIRKYEKKWWQFWL